MFGVRGIDGEVFRGPLERLLAAHRVDALSPTRVIEQDAGETSPHERVAAPHHDDARYRAAVAAYSSVQTPAPDRGPVFHAYQVMSRKVLALPPGTGVETAWRVLEVRGVGQAPVVNEAEVVVGLVSRANLLHVLNEQGGRVTDVRARRVVDVMTTPVVTVDPVVDVRRIARAMLEYHLPALPVVDETSGRLLGIVSRGDILRCVVADPPLTLWA